jgi:hypothetical protein
MPPLKGHVSGDRTARFFLGFFGRANWAGGY